MDEKGEKDPFGRNPHDLGSKLDAGKAPLRKGLLQQFPRACIAVAEVSAFGAEKYTWNGWKTVPDGIVRYGNAADRHVVAEAVEGRYDSQSGLLHQAHVAWNALAVLELMIIEEENASSS